MAEYIVGIDGGGTKTDAVCADMSGQILTRATAGPTSLTATSLGMASMNLVEVFRQLTSELKGEMTFPRVVIGVAGLDTPDEMQRAEEVFRGVLTNYQIGKFMIVNDIRLVLAAATKADHIVALIAGTGSQCYGVTADGKTAKASGMDFLLADQGSGYEIGRKVLRVATASADGRVPKSVLERLVLDHFHASDFDDLKSKVYFPILNKTQVGELAKVCVDAYEQGDVAAVQIIHEVIDDLVVMAEAVIRRLELQSLTTELLCSGSVIRLPFVFEAVRQRLSATYPQLHVTMLEQEPAKGAVQLALKSLHAEKPEST